MGCGLDGRIGIGDGTEEDVRDQRGEGVRWNVWVGGRVEVEAVRGLGWMGQMDGWVQREEIGTLESEIVDLGELQVPIPAAHVPIDGCIIVPATRREK